MYVSPQWLLCKHISAANNDLELNFFFYAMVRGSLGKKCTSFSLEYKIFQVAKINT